MPASSEDAARSRLFAVRRCAFPRSGDRVAGRIFSPFEVSKGPEAPNFSRPDVGRKFFWAQIAGKGARTGRVAKKLTLRSAILGRKVAQIARNYYFCSLIEGPRGRRILVGRTNGSPIRELSEPDRRLTRLPIGKLPEPDRRLTRLPVGKLSEPDRRLARLSDGRIRPARGA